MALWGTATHEAVWAQPSRTLTIQNGAVYMDGEPVPPKDLPRNLNLDGVTMQLRFPEGTQSRFEINGNWYTVDNGLKPIPNQEAQQDSGTFMRTQRTDAMQPAAPARRAVPTEEHEQYLGEVQRRNEELYRSLRKEQKMQAETYILASHIRELSEGPEREQHLDSLRTMLNEIFELMQENRRLQVQMLEGEIDELERRLQKREDLREEIIDQRIRELVGELP